MTRETRIIDDTRPKAEVYGLPGVAYEQDGILYTSAGVEAMPEDYAQAPEDEVPPDDPYDPHIGLVVIQGEGETSQASTVNDTFETMHHMQLKALMRTYGFDWTDRENAIHTLRNLKKSA